MDLAEFCLMRSAANRPKLISTLSLASQASSQVQQAVPNNQLTNQGRILPRAKRGRLIAAYGNWR